MRFTCKKNDLMQGLNIAGRTVAQKSSLSAIEGITEYAEKNDVDLIIMGRRGLVAFRGALGSVSYGILRATDVPVLTIK